VDKAVPILQGLVDALIRGQEPLGDWSTFRDALSTLFGADVGNIITEVTSAIQDFLTSLQPMVAFVQANLQPILVGLAAIIADLVIPGFVAWATAAISGAAAAIVALAPVLVPVLAIGAAAALLYQAWTTNFLGIQDVTASVVAVVQSVVQAVLGQVTTFVQNHGAQIQSFFASAYQQVQAIIGTAWEIIKAIIGAALTFIQGTIVPWLAQISTFISEHTTQIQAIFDGAWMIISNLIQAYLTLIQGILSAVMAAIQGDWSGAWQIVQDTLSSVWGNIQGIVNGALQILQNALTTAWDAIKNQVSSVWNGIAGTISSIWDGIVGSIKGSINSIIDSINTLIAGFNSISGAVGGPQIGQIPHLATGTRFFAGGLALVGERGPELAMLPRGAQVLNHRDTRLALAGAGNVTFGDIIIQGDIRSRADVDYLVDQIDQRIGRKALARTRV
jgi:phage-related protein